MIYLDYAATTPVDQRVMEKMLPYFTKIFANPSSKHTCGKKATKAVNDSRKLLADLFGATEEEIIFTGSASESNNLAIKGVADLLERPAHFITTAFEHKCVLEAFNCLRSKGHTVTVLSPNEKGFIEVEDIKNALQPNTVLCSVMYVNNEIGTINPIEGISNVCRKNGVLFHCDATQAFGKLPVRANLADLISISAHKFCGPKGVGALYAASIVPIKCQISGGSQEYGIRAGTTNVPGIVGISEAAKIACSEMDENIKNMKSLEEVFLNEIKNNIPMSFLQGCKDNKVPWINNICFYNADGGEVRDRLGELETCVSRSSACAKSSDPSHVLQSIGTRQELLAGAIRFSFGRFTTEEDVVTAAHQTARIIEEIRRK